jgi:hypothetical protein
MGNTRYFFETQQAWMYKDGVNRELGLTGAAFIDPRYGAGWSGVGDVNNQGQAVGVTKRFDAPTSDGREGASAWYFDGNTTVELFGPSGAQYTGPNGHRQTSAGRVNEAGQILGSSNRYDPVTGQDRGSSSWLYDLATDQYFDFTLSTSNTGDALSSALYLGEDGLVLGNYLYYKNGVYQGWRAFAFTMLDGLTDLGLLIDGDLTADGWSALASAFRGNDSAIRGSGTKDGNNQGFLLTAIPGKSATRAGLLPDAIYQGPYVPEPPHGVPIPGAFWLMGSSLAGLVAFKRRKNS